MQSTPVSATPAVAFRWAPALVAVTSLLPTAHGDETVHLSSHQSEKILLRGAGGGGIDDPNDPMNCDEVHFPRINRYAIHQSSKDASSQKEADRRYRSEVYFAAAVLDTSSAIHGYHTGGSLYGVEFDWLFPFGQNPPTSNRLPEASNIYESDGNGGWTLVCKMYCYDADQYATRKGIIETGIEHTMESRKVWIGATATATGSGGDRLQVTTGGNDVYGDLASASGAKVEGTANVVNDGIYHVRPLSVHQTNIVTWDESATSVVTPSIPFTESAARTEAQTYGTYYSSDVVITSSNTPNDGVVFSEGNITVSGDDLTGSWTFVSAVGTVTLSGDDLTVTPYKDLVAAVSFAGDVEVSGTRSDVLGEIHAPTGLVEISAGSARVHGILHGDRVHITGSGTVITDGTDPQ